jgi:hypothetical protein
VAPMRSETFHLRRSPTSTLGQHNDEILGGKFGPFAEELADLRARKIIGERPSFMWPETNLTEKKAGSRGEDGLGR